MVGSPRDRGGTGPRWAGGGGRDRRGGPHRGERRGGGAPVERPVGPTDEAAVLVDRREGVRVVKVSTVERASRRVVRVVYRVEFVGHDPIGFDRLGAARERAAGPPPNRRGRRPPRQSEVRGRWRRAQARPRSEVRGHRSRGRARPRSLVPPEAGLDRRHPRGGHGATAAAVSPDVARMA